MNINKPKTKPTTKPTTAEATANEAKRIAEEKREFRKDINKRSDYLAKLGSSEATPEEGLGKILKTLRTTEDEYMFFAAVEWCVKSNSAYYDKRNQILGAMVRNFHFRQSSSVGTILKFYKQFDSEVVKDLLKKHQSINANSAVRSMRKMSDADIAVLAGYMPVMTKRKFVAKANSLSTKWVQKASKASPVKAVSYTESANSYLKVVNILNASLRGKTTTVPQQDAAVRQVPYTKPAEPEQKPQTVQIKYNKRKGDSI
jgi:hypothetical protein